MASGLGFSRAPDHQARPSLLALGRPFLSRLEDELHGAGQFGAQFGENFRRCHQDGSMSVVAAGMHDAGFPPLPSRPNLRGKGKINLFGHRQGIHIGAEGDHRPRLAALEDGHNTRMRDLVAYLVTELPEMLDHQS